MSLLVIAYVAIKNQDFEIIQDFRKKNDLFYSVVDPHFTLVFPVNDFTKEAFIEEITAKSKDVFKIDFVLRCATINKDTFSDYYHIFLVPDEGFSKIVKLHDQLYAENLREHLRLDIDFIPHLCIGNSKDPFVCKAWVDRWNAQDFSIPGIISELTVIEYLNGQIKELKKIELKLNLQSI